MAHVTRIKAGDKKSEDEPKKVSTSKNVKEAVKIAKKIVKEEKAVKKEKTKKVKKEKKPMNKFTRVITAPFRYVHDSWTEIRQVRWPNRKATWKMVVAVLIYTAIFVILISLLDLFFKWLFNLIIK